MNTDPPYRTDLINAAMGARRLSNAAVAKKAGVGPMTVSKIRNGYTQVGYVTLKKVVEAIGLTVAQVSEPRQDELIDRLSNSLPDAFVKRSHRIDRAK